MKKSLCIFVVIALVLGAGTMIVQRSAANTPNDVVIIVHPSQNISSISRDDIAKLFLKKTTQWSDGTKVEPVDLSEDSNTRALFSEAFLGKKVSAISSYWQQQIFSGRAVPPEVKPTDSDVVSFVKANSHAIGYVSKGTTVEGVKIVTVVD